MVSGARASEPYRAGRHALVGAPGRTGWTAQTPASKVAIFYAVSSPSSTACTAVGTSSEGAANFLAAAERWNGTTLSKETTTRPEGIYASTQTWSPLQPRPA